MLKLTVRIDELRRVRFIVNLIRCNYRLIRSSLQSEIDPYCVNQAKVESP